MNAIFDDVTGHYVQMTIGDDVARVYYEQCGEGIPLLCLHTAGADGRRAAPAAGASGWRRSASAGPALAVAAGAVLA